MKKVLACFVLGIFLVSFGMNFVTAADPFNDLANGLTRFMTGVWEVLKVPLAGLVGDDSQSGDLFVAKIMLLLIVFSFSFVAVKQIPLFKEDNFRWAVWLVAGAVSILSIRYLGELQAIESILVPYSTFGIALTAGIPFILYFFLVKGFESSVARRISWIFFAVIFIGIWYVRMDEGQIGGLGVWIYGVTALAAVIMFMMDGTIHKFFGDINSEKVKNLHEAKMRSQVRVMRKELEERLLAVGIYSSVDDPDYQAEDEHIKKLEKKYGLIK